MIAEGKLIADVAEGNAASQELRVTGEAFKKLREQLIEAWQLTDPRDEKGREKLWLATTQLTQVERALRSTVDNGKIAQKELDAIRTAGERKSLFSRLKPTQE